MDTDAKTKAGSRRRLLDAALLEFSEHGLAGARVDRIAALARANKAMIYYHFTSKESLYKALIAREAEKIGNMLRTALAESNDPETVLRNVAENYMAFINKENLFVPIVIREMASGGQEIIPALKTVISRRGIQEKMITIIESGKQHGKFRNIDSRQAMISFIGMNLFYLIFSPLVNMIWEIDDEKDFRQRRPAETVDLFMRGLLAR